MRILFVLLSLFFILNADVVLAKVNGVTITQNDAKVFLSATNPTLTYEALSKQQKIQLIQKMVQKELFLQVAKKEKIDQTQAYAKELEVLKKELMLNIWLKTQTDFMIVSNGDAKKFYDQNKQKFIEPTRVKARQIVVATPREAQRIIAALKKLKGATLKNTFVAIAKHSSIDSATKASGGDLGEFTKEDISPEFSDVAWGLQAGTISLQPIKTDQGYHIIYIEARLAPAAIPFAQAKPQIIALIKQQQFQLYISQLTSQLSQKAKIEIAPQNIK